MPIVATYEILKGGSQKGKQKLADRATPAQSRNVESVEVQFGLAAPETDHCGAEPE